MDTAGPRAQQVPWRIDSAWPGWGHRPAEAVLRHGRHPVHLLRMDPTSTKGSFRNLEGRVP